MTDQASLFDVRPGRLARRRDPQTSHDAARSLAGHAGTVRRQLLQAYRSAPEGYTSEEAAAHAAIDPWQASKRTSDLKALGLIAATGQVRSGSSGRAQQVLAITDAGREALG